MDASFPVAAGRCFSAALRFVVRRRCAPLTAVVRTSCISMYFRVCVSAVFAVLRRRYAVDGLRNVYQKLNVAQHRVTRLDFARCSRAAEDLTCPSAVAHEAPSFVSPSVAPCVKCNGEERRGHPATAMIAVAAYGRPTLCGM